METQGSERPDRAVAACETLTAEYRKAGARLQEPAVRKVISSILAQKVEQTKSLRAAVVAGREPGPDTLFRPVEPLPESGGAAATLAAMAERENAFAADLYALSSLQTNEELRVELKALAEASRKCAGWAKDHLDLIALF